MKGSEFALMDLFHQSVLPRMDTSMTCIALVVAKGLLDTVGVDESIVHGLKGQSSPGVGVVKRSGLDLE